MTLSDGYFATEPMTEAKIAAMAFFIVPMAHMLIRRLQDRFRPFWIHTVLFALSCVLGAGLAAGWTAWVTLPGMAVVALISQYVYMREA